MPDPRFPGMDAAAIQELAARLYPGGRRLAPSEQATHRDLFQRRARFNLDMLRSGGAGGAPRLTPRTGWARVFPEDAQRLQRLRFGMPEHANPREIQVASQMQRRPQIRYPDPTGAPETAGEVSGRGDLWRRLKELQEE